MGQWGKVGVENGLVFIPHIDTIAWADPLPSDKIDKIMLLHEEKDATGTIEELEEKYIGMNYFDYLLQIQ